MDCRDFKDLAPALALETLNDSKRAACASHLLSAGPHDGCREVDAEARRVAARLAGVLPDHPVHPRVWEAIEQSLKAGVAEPLVAPSRRPRWREIGSWMVATAVLGLYLHNRPPPITASLAGTAIAAAGVPERAATLMMDREMRRYLFRPAQGGNARAALMFAPSFRGALILVDRVAPPPPGQELHLWAVRGAGHPPALLIRIGLGKEGNAMVEVATATLFDPALPGQLWLSTDPTDATAPASVVLVANFDAHDTGAAAAATDQSRQRQDQSEGARAR